jgi:hypothetical protein
MYERLTPLVRRELAKEGQVHAFDFVHLMKWDPWKPYHVGAVLNALLEDGEARALPRGMVELVPQAARASKLQRTTARAVEHASAILNELPLGTHKPEIIEMASGVGRLFDAITKRRTR